MDTEGFKYHAFISYSHKDKKIAQRLHKRLRRYHLPSVLRRLHPELPKKLGTIFLDEANLVAKDGSLTESLRGYLDASNYLILICSPDSAKSEYVNDEVEYFMKIGRRKHIVPLIVRGVPRSKDPNAECFVPAVLELTRELEPLGIDLKTYGERDSFLRVIATTLELDLEYFISIEDRERKRRAMIYSSISAVLAVGAGILIWYNINFFQVMYDAEAQKNLALTYLGGIGVQQDYDRAAAWFTKAANNGNAEAQFYLGVMYKNGYSFERDDAKALEWYEKAAINGDSTAQNNLGYMYQKGDGVEQNYSKALEWFRKAADNGSSEAQFNIGLMYQSGEGVEQDDAKARAWFEKSADNNNAVAQYNMGYMYQHGLLGVGQDYAKAREWYEKSAANGIPQAECNLGYFYMNALGVDRDYVKAREWYEKSAAHGYALAQKNLAYIYEKGLGVDKDPVKAKELYDQAASQDM